MNKIDILGVNFDNVNMNEAMEKCQEFLQNDKSNSIYTPNPEIVMKALENKEFMDILNSGSLVIPDGIGIVIASKIFKTPLKERVAGFDLICNLLELGKNGDISYFLLGHRFTIEAKNKLEEKYPNISIVGTYEEPVIPGKFHIDEEKIIPILEELKPDIILVGLRSCEQEAFINKYINNNIFKIAIGCGGTIDVLSGQVKRAPKIFIKLHLEWFYRLLKNPSRIGRMMVLPKFLLKVIFK